MNPLDIKFIEELKPENVMLCEDCKDEENTQTSFQSSLFDSLRWWLNPPEQSSKKTLGIRLRTDKAGLSLSCFWSHHSHMGRSGGRSKNLDDLSL